MKNNFDIGKIFQIPRIYIKLKTLAIYLIKINKT